MDLKDDKVAFQQQMQMALPLDIILRDNPSQCPLLGLPHPPVTSCPPIQCPQTAKAPFFSCFIQFSLTFTQTQRA